MLGKNKRRRMLRGLLPADPKDSEAILNALLDLEQHPIAIAVLGAAMLEYELDEVLRTRLKHRDDETWAKLVDSKGPFDSFYAKIISGYAFAIYNEDFRDDLHIVRIIRNAFAHPTKLLDFHDRPICEELSSANYLFKRYKPELLKAPTNRHGRAAYISLCFSLALKLKRAHLRRMKARGSRVQQQLLLKQSPYAMPLLSSLNPLAKLSPDSPEAIGILGHYLSKSRPEKT